MTVAWYWHLKALRGAPPWVTIVISWSIALLEYCFPVPANRIGYQTLSLPQLKVLQEVITMVVFAGFSVAYMKVPFLRHDMLASALLVGAVWLIFSEQRP